MSDEKTDIVERLRDEGFITHMARLPRESKILQKAADEIERLRAELAAMREQRDEAYAHLRHEAKEIAECRRGRSTAKSVAKERGWKCFSRRNGGGA